MQFLTSAPEEDYNHGLIRGENLLLPDVRRQSAYNIASEQIPEASSFQLGRLFRKYWILLLLLVILGAAAGFISVVFSSPLYRSRMLLEVQNSSGALRSGEGSSGEAGEIDIQTQVNILHSGSFLKRGADRMQSDNVPLVPSGKDIFSRLRQKIHPTTQDPVEVVRTGLAVAVGSFDARPVNRTRLIELNTQSTSPDVAAQFLNSMAQEFIDDSRHSRLQIAQRTSEWLANQIEETKSRVLESEERLRDFVQASGNLFAGQDVTLDDSKLTQLKAELARIQEERIARQTRFELTQKYPPDQLGEILDDTTLRGYQKQIGDLKREKAVLLTTLTERHEKVRKLDVQLSLLQREYDAEVSSVLKRIKHDYEGSMQHERLLAKDYAGQSQRVGSEAGKAAQFNALKREVETQRQMYQSLLMQQNQANLSGSVPVSPIRVVEVASAADAPYKPQPVLNISLGTMLGLALSVGLVLLNERMDRSIKVPGATRRMFNTPELGVIPNLQTKGSWLSAKNRNGALGDAGTTVAAVAPPFITESFRSTLASIIRSQANGRAHKIILVTSPGPSEGKTTVVQNLGVVLAESGRKVLLVDADFRRPHLHRKFGLPNEWGMIDLLSEDTPLSEYSPEKLAVPTGVPGLSIIPNRVTQDNVAKALYSPRLRATLDMLSDRYDMILVDAPPILSVADARIIAPLADALILVLRCGVTNRESAMEAYQRLQEDGVSLLGTVLTDYHLSGDRRRQYYYQYGDPSRT
jgi:succinoglycan biosynthesis transport protein ExoP